jgi:hypothetical protein
VEAVVCGHADVEACWPTGARYRIRVDVGGEGSVLDATLRLPDPASRS